MEIFSVWSPAGGIVESVAIPNEGFGLRRPQTSIVFLWKKPTEPLMHEILARLWQNLYGRVAGPMNLRLIIQPTVATILAVRAGLRDARQDRPPFFWAVLWNPAHRPELLRHAWKDVGKVFVLSIILDVVYQLIVHRGVYTLELLITAVTLAIVPYILLRGPISRVAKMVFTARSVTRQRAKTQ